MPPGIMPSILGVDSCAQGEFSIIFFASFCDQSAGFFSFQKSPATSRMGRANTSAAVFMCRY